jgi:hypothetical protein
VKALGAHPPTTHVPAACGRVCPGPRPRPSALMLTLHVIVAVCVPAQDPESIVRTVSIIRQTTREVLAAQVTKQQKGGAEEPADVSVWVWFGCVEVLSARTGWGAGCSGA